ncbi:MAG: hypothetical protein AAB649_04295 [Patescibacteria group bacterium]
MKNASKILSVCQSGGVEAMLAINPKTQTENLSLHLDAFKYLQLLAVPPGKAGQVFDESIIEKIKFLRAHAPNAIIEVDGGMNPETAKKCHEAGAHLFVSASFILNSSNPEEAYQTLLEATRHHKDHHSVR